MDLGVLNITPVRMTTYPHRLQLQTSLTGGILTGKMIFWREECLAEVVHIIDMVVLKVPTLVRLIHFPHRLLHIKYQCKTSFPKTKMMFPWPREIFSVMPITVMILPFLWPFLGHVAYYPLPRLVCIVPSFPDYPWSQSSSSEYNGNLDTVNLTAVKSNLQRSSGTTSL